MTNRIGYIKENRWESISKCLGVTLNSEDNKKLIVEIHKASRQLHLTLGLRPNSISVETRYNDLWLRVSGIAGILKIGSFTFQITPKFVGRVESDHWQNSILRIIQRVQSKHFTRFRVHGLNQERLSIIDHIALAYIDALSNGLRGDPVQVYKTHDHSGEYMRGRLDLGIQIRTLFSKPHILYSEISILDSNNECNQLLHWGVQQLKKLVLNNNIYNQLSKLQSQLPIINLRAAIPAKLPPFIPPQYKPWQEAVDIAVSLAKGTGAGQSKGKTEGYGYLLNMERLFEGFIEHSLIKTKPFWENKGFTNITFHPQHSKLFATTLNEDQSNYFSIPDNLICNNNKPLILVDAKYKSLVDSEDNKKKRPLISDVYQLFSALVAHDCKVGLLIYPKIADNNIKNLDEIKLWEINNQTGKVIIGALSVDISLLNSADSLRMFDENLFLNIFKLTSSYNL